MHPKYQEAIELRKIGQSYGEIAKCLNISKSSASQWCQRLKLSKAAQKILKKKTRRSHEQLLMCCQRQSEMARERSAKTKETAAKRIRALSEYELLLIGTALYWAEGWNKEKLGKLHSLSFANSDPDMIKIFLCFLYKSLNIPKEKIVLYVYIHPNISAENAIKFWSKITGFHTQKFRSVCQVSRASKGKRDANSLPYGTLKISVNNCQKFCEVKGLIQGLKSKFQ